MPFARMKPRDSAGRSGVRRLILSAAAALFLAGAASAQKTDVVVLSNGDRITGEIKSYGSGKLAVDTAHSGWGKVKWTLIESIASDKQFEIEAIDGRKFYGSLSASDPVGGLVIVSGSDRTEIPFLSVFALSPVFQTFWKRWDGSLDMGFNYTSSSNLTQFNLDAA